MPLQAEARYGPPCHTHRRPEGRAILVASPCAARFRSGECQCLDQVTVSRSLWGIVQLCHACVTYIAMIYSPNHGVRTPIKASGAVSLNVRREPAHDERKGGILSVGFHRSRLRYC
ncbi:hypothetical protein BV20DRAFT_76358 [Pilatotrama ljubarskyi]|nr:hypothetical protein BV20DRAFT_76358 [Pilatotrama ljubarskyi]